MYFVAISPDRIAIEILPDVRRLRPPWQHATKKPWDKSCELDYQAEHPFALQLPGWEQGFTVRRVEGGRNVPVATEGNRLKFAARPGQYVVERVANH